jgi:redox-sensitive bicupin YhaK (pirin superfamily)
MGLSEDKMQGRNIGQDFHLKDGYRMYHGQRIPGFPYHPHRGFETITINKEGVVDHTDSLGASGRFAAGDVQWMTAGKGVQHSEMFPMVNEHAPNTLEIFQVWLNLPAKKKMVAPHFKMLWKEAIPKVVKKDDADRGTETNVIAGNYDGIQALPPTPDSWAADPLNLVTVLTVKLDPDASWRLPATDPTVNRVLYFYKGSNLEIDKEQIPVGSRVVVDAGQDVEIRNGESTGFVLVLQGRPINEPVVKYGPYVMNTEEEIRQTMRDYGQTQFGGWPWPEQEYVHAQDAGRFAKHADGRIEQPQANTL